MSRDSDGNRSHRASCTHVLKAVFSPQRVIIFPAPPNQIVVSVENLDIGVTGNLGGQVNILVPIALFGIVQLNAHQVSSYTVVSTI
jgi:hypothetical protein